MSDTATSLKYAADRAPNYSGLMLKAAKEIESLQSRIDELESQLAEAKKDTERIDYMATEANRTVHFLAGNWYWSKKPYKTYYRKETIRAAIDAAMTNEGGK